ncbi:MAG: NapC/NirT family cytochrome c [Actinomycetia bacterium]|nr:NapC/NirT family cytochrome c [Actinomycetes bacterium]
MEWRRIDPVAPHDGRKKEHIIDDDRVGESEPPQDSSSGPGNGRRVVSLYRHPLAAAGAALVVAGGMAFIFLVVQDFTSETENPYRSLITFIAIPAVVGLGAFIFLLSIRIQVVSARKRGERVAFRIEPTDPRYMRSLWLFLALSAAGVAVVGFVGFQAYEATDSTSFCGDACHTPMEPQAVAHQESAHARVKCVECHIGPGTEAYIDAKINGMKQLWGVLTDTYDRPVETPIEMRSAEAICEECHWRDNFLGTKVRSATYYSLDDASSPWTVNFLFDLGDAGSTPDQPGGVHWHTSGGTVVEYIATDHELQDIPWVRVIEEDGTEREYTTPGEYVPLASDSASVVRRFDCLDCHNRPAHPLEPASRSINNALSNGIIPDILPEIKDIAMQVLLNGYEDRDAAHQGIPDSLQAFYATEYPDAAEAYPTEIDEAARALIDIYDVNFFPEMKTDYRARQYNIGHLSWEGCFRCHDGEKADESGSVISNECNVCHLIVGQGPGTSGVLLDLDVSGLEFEHPYGVSDWRERSCASCHAELDGM